MADELCVVRSMVGELPLHGQQNLLLHTGRVTGGHPSFGSWVSYGLGTETDNLPGYVVLNNDWVPNGGLENFGSAFLPAVHQATMLAGEGRPGGQHRARPTGRRSSGASSPCCGEQDAAFADVAGDRDGDRVRHPRITRRPSGCRPAVPDVADVSRETRRDPPAATASTPRTSTSATTPSQCLRARRLVEAGVRFVEITCPLTHANNSPWDQHGQLKKYHAKNARITDQPVAALIADLKAARPAGQDDRPLGRRDGPHAAHPGGDAGRPAATTTSTATRLWLAGGGFKGGTAYGATDEFGNAVGGEPADGPRHPRHDPAPARASITPG